MQHLTHLFLEKHKAFMESLMVRYIDADLIIVASRNELGNRLSFSKWGNPEKRDRLFFPRTISVTEQISAITEMASPHSGRTPDLAAHARRLMEADSKGFLAHVLLHEIAHVLNNWGSDREPDCNRWACEQLAQLGI